MSKKSKSTTIIGIVMLVSLCGIDAISDRYFAVWSEQMGILAYIFKMIIIFLIGLVTAVVIDRKTDKKSDFIDEDYEIEFNDERNVIIRSKVGLFMWRANMFLLIALMMLMITLKIPVAAWCILALVALNLIGFFVCFNREDKRH